MRTCPKCESTNIKIKYFNEAGLADPEAVKPAPSRFMCRDCGNTWVPDPD